MGAISTIALVGAGLAAGGAVSVLAKRPKVPDMPDPRVERAKAETEAAQKSNSKLAARNRARAASSLLAKSAESADSPPATLGGGRGKTTLGQ